jgi:NAD-dependent oxidoreductase involved in siderophore biosynthesis
MKNKIIEQSTNGMFGSLDVLHLLVFRSSLELVENDNDLDNCLKDFSDCLEAAIRRGKHWFLNPFFQRVAAGMEEGKYLKDAIYEIASQSSKREIQKIDSTKNYVKILMEVDILVINAKEFLDDPLLNVESASVQTDFFKIPL